jgi:hypothetical protein
MKYDIERCPKIKIGSILFFRTTLCNLMCQGFSTVVQHSCTMFYGKKSCFV